MTSTTATPSPATELSAQQKMELWNKGFKLAAAGGWGFIIYKGMKQHPEHAAKIIKVAPLVLTGLKTFFG